MTFLNATTGFLFLALAALGLTVAAGMLGGRRRQRLVTRILGSSERVEALTDACYRRRRLKQVLLLVGVAMVVLALARPWWGRHLVPATNRARDVLVALDCSRSMLAQDVAPSRLDHAKWLIRTLIERSPGDRFGLIAFAGDAFLECPLTRDRNTLFTFLDDLDTRTIPVGGTNIAEALQEARDAFKAAEGGDHAVVLVSDGDELQGDAISQAKALQGQGVPLLVVGLGDAVNGSMIRLPDGSYLRDAKGEFVSSKLNEAKMRELARIAKGIYLRSTAISPNIDPLVDRIQALIPDQGDEQTRLQPIERYQLPLAFGVALLIARLFIGDRRRPLPRAASQVVLGAALWLVGSGSAIGQGTASSAVPLPASSTGSPPDKLATQIEALESELAAAPLIEQARLHYNLGVLCQQQNDPEAAASHYRQALASTDSERLGALAQWNLGTVRHFQGMTDMTTKPAAALTRFEEAETAYQNAMRLLPGNTGLGSNQELLLRDREFAEQLKKMQDLQKKAAQQAQDARDKQRETNEAGPSEQPDQQQQAEQKTEEARQSTQALKDLIDKLKPETKPGDGNDQQQDPVQQAMDQLDEATKAQQEAQQLARTADDRQRARQDALQKLNDAVASLGGDQPDNQKPQDSDQPKPQQGDSQPQSDEPQQPPDQQGDPMQQLANQPANADKPPSSSAEDLDGKYAEAQADAILRRMLADEQDLREALKEYQRRQYRQQETEQDW